MTPLRQQMIDAMLVRGFSPRTHQSYLSAVAGLARHDHRSPDRISLAEIEGYFLYLVKERQLSDASCRLYLRKLPHPTIYTSRTREGWVSMFASTLHPIRHRSAVPLG